MPDTNPCQPHPAQKATESKRDPKRHRRFATRWLWRYLDESEAIAIDDAAVAGGPLLTLADAAVVAHDFDAAEELLDPDVETVTPRGSLRGIGACRQVLQKALGEEQFALDQAEPEFEEIEGDIIARTHEIARWRETGDVAYERDFAVRLTLDDERVGRVVGRAALASQWRLTGGLSAARVTGSSRRLAQDSWNHCSRIGRSWLE